MLHWYPSRDKTEIVISIEEHSGDFVTAAASTRLDHKQVSELIEGLRIQNNEPDYAKIFKDLAKILRPEAGESLLEAAIRMTGATDK